MNENEFPLVAIEDMNIVFFCLNTGAYQSVPVYNIFTGWRYDFDDYQVDYDCPCGEHHILIFAEE